MPRRFWRASRRPRRSLRRTSPYTIRVRYPDSNRSSLEAMSNTLLNSAADTRRRLGTLATVTELPGQTEIRRENLQRDVVVTARLEGRDLGSGVAAVQKAVDDLHLPPSIRVEYGGTYAEQQQSFHDLMMVLVLAIVLVFRGAAVRVPNVGCTDCDSVVGAAVDLGRISRAADHPDDVQHCVVHGTDHGDRHRGQEWHPAARRRSAISRGGIAGARCDDSGRPPPLCGPS